MKWLLYGESRREIYKMDNIYNLWSCFWRHRGSHNSATPCISWLSTLGQKETNQVITDLGQSSVHFCEIWKENTEIGWRGVYQNIYPFLALRRHLFVAFCAHQTRYFSKKHECPVSTNDLLKVQISINIYPIYFRFLKRAFTSCCTCNSIPAMTTNHLWYKDQLL